jgi:hypothetical protein
MCYDGVSLSSLSARSWVCLSGSTGGKRERTHTRRKWLVANQSNVCVGFIFICLCVCV